MGKELSITETRFNEFRRINEISDTNYDFQVRLKEAKVKAKKLSRSLTNANKKIEQQKVFLKNQESALKRKSKKMRTFSQDFMEVGHEINDQNLFLLTKSSEMQDQLNFLLSHVKKGRVLESKLDNLAKVYGFQVEQLMDSYSATIDFLKKKTKPVLGLFEAVEGYFRDIYLKEISDIGGISGKALVKLKGKLKDAVKVFSTKRRVLGNFLRNVEDEVKRYEVVRGTVGSFNITGVAVDFHRKNLKYRKDLEKAYIP